MNLDRDGIIALDWEGHPVPPGEADDTVIKVWQISPHRDRSADYTVERSYQRAVEIAKETVEKLMDESVEVWPITVTIELAEMTLAEYQEIVDADW